MISGDGPCPAVILAFPVGFIGTILSTNLVSLYFFLEVLTLTLFFLMATFGYRNRVQVAFVSLAWGIVGALLFLVAGLIVYSHTGSLEIADLLDLGLAVLIFAEFLLNGFQLLTKELFALLIGHFFLGLFANIMGRLQHF